MAQPRHDALRCSQAEENFRSAWALQQNDFNCAYACVARLFNWFDSLLNSEGKRKKGHGRYHVGSVDCCDTMVSAPNRNISHYIVCMHLYAYIGAHICIYIHTMPSHTIPYHYHCRCRCHCHCHAMPLHTYHTLHYITMHYITYIHVYTVYVYIFYLYL